MALNRPSVPYIKTTDFSEFQNQNPNNPLPAPQVDQELERIALTINEIRQRLQMIQRDDGEVANKTIGIDQLKAELLAGVNPPTEWAPETIYSPGDTVVTGTSWLLTREQHLSSPTIQQDIDAGYWFTLIDLTIPIDNLITLTTPENWQDIDTVASNIADVNTTADNIGDIHTLVANILAINTNADNIDIINTAATNIADIHNFSAVWQGASSTNPVLRADGSPLQVGDLYFNTSSSNIKVWSGTSWITQSPFSGVREVIELSSGQTDVTFNAPIASANFYVFGLDVDNTRLLPGVDYTSNVSTNSIVLAQTYPSGSLIVSEQSDVSTVLNAADMVYNPDNNLPNTVGDALDNRQKVFNSVADMQADTTLFIGQKVRTLGYYTAGDGGGCDYEIVTAGTGTEDGGSFINLTGIAGQAKGLFGDTVNVKQFGARGNSANDDTNVIQSAISAAPSRGCVYIPSGLYRVTSTIYINRSDLTLTGDSSTSSYLLRTNGTYGDTIVVASSSPNTVAITGVTIKNIRVQCNVEMITGAHIHLINVGASFFQNLTLFNGYRGFHLEGVRTSHFTTTMIQSGSFSSMAREGSAYVFIGLPPTTTLENTEIFFSDFNWEFAGQPRMVENGVVIQEADGIWFSNGHIFGASNADMLLQSRPESDQLLAVICDNVWFDQECLRNLQITGGGALFGLNIFHSCRFTGADGNNVLVSPNSSMQGLAFHGCDFGVGSMETSVDIFSGVNVSFNGCRFEQINNSGASSSSRFINIPSTSTLSSLVVNACTFWANANLNYGIRLFSQNPKYHISGNAFVNFSTASEEILTNQATLDGEIVGNTTNRTFSLSATEGVQYVTPLCEFADLTGASVNINSIIPKWDNRKISFRANANSKTLVEGVDILSKSGGSITIPTGRARHLIYSRRLDRWYEV